VPPESTTNNNENNNPMSQSNLFSVVTGDKMYQSDIKVRNPVETPQIYDKNPIIRSIDPSMNMDFSRMIGKVFELTSFQWTTTQTASGTPIFTLGIPSSLLNLNKIASAPFDLSSLYHMRGCVVIQVAGTPFHSGALIAAVVPRLSTTAYINDYQCAPHAHLYANSSSAACIEIPWYSETKTRWTPSNNDGQDTTIDYGTAALSNNSDYAQLRVGVLGQLGAPSAASTTLTVTIAIKFLEMNFYVPKTTYPLSLSSVQESPNPVDITPHVKSVIDTVSSVAVVKPVTPQTQTILDTISNIITPAVPEQLVAQSLSFTDVSILGACLVSMARCIVMLWDKTHKKKEEAYGEQEVLQAQSMASSATKAIDGVFSVGKRFTSDVLDTARGWIRMYTGLHSPNIPDTNMRSVVAMRNNPNYVDTHQRLHKLDPYANYTPLFLEHFSDTSIDEGLISSMVSKPMAVSRVTINTTSLAGSILFTAPIHPCMFRTIAPGGFSQAITAPIHALSALSRFYSGTLNLKIENLGSNAHMYKLLVVREYYSSATMSTSVPPMQAVFNNPADILEFSAGGQVQTVSLPMASIYDYVPITSDYLTNGLVHGRVMIYLLQPLVTNGSVATSVDFIVHVSGDTDFKLYGHAMDAPLSMNLSLPASLSSSLTTPIAGRIYKDESFNSQLVLRRREFPDLIPVLPSGDKNKVIKDLALKVVKMSNNQECYIPTKPLKTKKVQQTWVLTTNDDAEAEQLVAQSHTESTSLDTPMNVSSDPYLVSSTSDSEQPPSLLIRPILHVRDHIRHMSRLNPIFFTTANTQSQAGSCYFDVASLLSRPNTTGNTALGLMQTISSMFYGYRGGLRFKFVIKGASNATISYVPPTPISYVNAGISQLAAGQPNMTNTIGDNDINIRFSALGNGQVNTYLGPELEATDWHYHTNSTTFMGNGSAPTTSSALSCECIVEAEIPYAHIERFIHLTPRPISNGYSGSLGWFVVGLVTQYSTVGASTVPGPVYVFPYVGASDDARFVYQVLGPQLSYGYVNPTPTTSLSNSASQGPLTDNPALISVNASQYYIGSAA